MKTTVWFLMFVMVLFSSFDAQAYKLGDNEFINNIGAELALSEAIGLRGSYTHFYVPKAANHIHFIYLGPTFMISDFLWISPQAGFAGNWTAEKDAFYASLWLNFNLFKGKLTLFNEADAVFYDGKLQDYYGFTSCNYHYSNLSFGLQYEQVNTSFKAGPHVAFSKGLMSVEAQVYLINNNLDTFNFRIVTSLSF